MPSTQIPNSGFLLFPPLNSFNLFSDETTTFNVESLRLSQNDQVCNFSASEVYPVNLTRITGSFPAGYTNIRIAKIAIYCRPNYNSEQDNPIIKNS